MTTYKNKKEEVLLMANEAVNGDRNIQYGDPNVDFQRTATMWNMLIAQRLNQKLDSGLTPDNLLTSADVGLMMILLKCSREMHAPKLDNMVDIAGYAACSEHCKPSTVFQQIMEDLTTLNQPIRYVQDHCPALIFPGPHKLVENCVSGKCLNGCNLIVNRQ